MSTKIGAVIVAGGLSSRMNKFKPLMMIGNKTMIETTIDNFKVFGVDEIVVVTGYRSDDIENKIKNLNVKCIKNEKYESTHMFDSVCIGLKELLEKVDLIFVLPSDSPFVQQFTLKKMMDEMLCEENENIKLIQPSFEGKNGHPLLMNKNSVNMILTHDGTMGLQGVIAKMSSGYKNMNFVDPGIVLDADTINDYLNLLIYNENKSCPSVELCKKIQDYFHMSYAVKAHSDKVAEAAMNILHHLCKNGSTHAVLDKNIILAASMLHDISKGSAHHEKIGAQLLLDMGYEEISKIVKEHMELETISHVLTEKEVVYLADKLVKGTNLVTINERFSYKEELFKNNETVKSVVEKRKDQALYLYSLIFESLEIVKLKKLNCE